jgi:hypothetical protein
LSVFGWLIAYYSQLCFFLHRRFQVRAGMHCWSRYPALSSGSQRLPSPATAGSAAPARLCGSSTITSAIACLCACLFTGCRAQGRGKSISLYPNPHVSTDFYYSIRIWTSFFHLSCTQPLCYNISRPFLDRTARERRRRSTPFQAGHHGGTTPHS